jgi:hypothetical protein
MVVADMCLAVVSLGPVAELVLSADGGEWCQWRWWLVVAIGRQYRGAGDIHILQVVDRRLLRYLGLLNRWVRRLRICGSNSIGIHCVQDGVAFEDVYTSVKQRFQHVWVVHMPVGVGYLDAEHYFVLKIGQ